MTEKGYNINEIAAQVRSAGNPQRAAMEAVADTEYLGDSELLEALGVASFGDLPTTPYPDAPIRTRPDSGGQDAPSGQSGPAAKPRKKPGPKPGAKRKSAMPQNAPAASGTLRDALGRALGGLEEFATVWGSVLSDPHGPFSAAQVETLAQIDETASIFLSGWDAAALAMTGTMKGDHK